MEKPTRIYTTEKLSEHISETPEGFLLCRDVPIARTGEYIYKANEVPKRIQPGADGLVKVLRDEDEVFSDVAVSSFEGKPVTINHPSDFVTAENWKDYAHGVAQNVRRGEGEMSDLLIADLLLTTSDAIRLVKAGLREVSNGYDAQYEQLKPGVARQVGIVGNHIALVVKGRAGSRCAIMDKACTCCANCTCGDNYKCKEDKGEMKDKKTVKDVLISIFPKLKPVLDSVKDDDFEPVAEESTGGVAEAQAAAAEAKEAAVEAVEAAKKAAAAAEAAAVKPAGAEADAGAEAGAAEASTEADPIAAMNAKLDKLIGLMEALLASVTEEEGGEEEGGELESLKTFLAGNETELDAEAGGTEGEKKEEMTDEDEKEASAIAEELAGKTKDAIWQDVISKADIISPGIVATKPKAANMDKTIEAVKRKALEKALTKDSAKVIAPLLGGKKVAELTKDAVDIVFNASSEMIGRLNTSKVQKPAIQVKDLSNCNILAEINDKNRKFWEKNKVK